MKNGPYELVIAPQEYPGRLYRGRYCYEHHLVVWRNSGRLIQDEEVVHHINGNKRDNRIENLEVISKAEHNRHHGLEREKIVFNLTCSHCGQEFERRTSQYHRNQMPFCSRQCIGKYNFYRNRKSIAT